MTYLDAAGWTQRGESGQTVVALGGGHGLSATLRALRHITRSLTAIVTVADDGGSSGRLRTEMDILPPGDLRMALASLCEDTEWGLTWRDVMQLRLKTAGPLDGHALGNLLIAGLWQLLDDPVEGLEWVARLLGANGRVLPMANDPINIEADLDDNGRLYTVSGQSKVAVAPGMVRQVRIEPAEPEVAGVVTEAIAQADWVVLGPGSWYTSVIPHMLVPDIHRALVTTDAHRALILNLSRQRGETDKMTTGDHVRVLRQYAPDLKLDVVIADPTATDDIDDLIQASEELGARVVLRQVRTGDGAAHHDPLRLAAALRDAFDGFLGEVGRTESWLP
ncbi:uridine diphosphate-N-acetylglucosamine-binding protein YvcK [Schaalia sp. ZJ405]|uniref:gluconeogenesis factor YvcK family protein n=1 Tax=unclassified Schaalia TaxID=2691889 RepID=UPI0013EAFAAF|nr:MULTISPECIES: uridine diphosphate-N-acetylglucosamine-binding protein YvcK [unclassified Schaalia]QPK80479.1 uridine diphosphate-N-acetylglucosamine-binding protein YvcK [Schaalia sp. ZJ405]